MPQLAVGIVLSGIGAGLSVAANNASQSAIDDARHKSAAAQQQLQNRSRGVFENAITNNSAASANAQIAKGQGERQNALAALKTLSDQQQTTRSPLAAPVQAATERAATAGNAWSSAVTNAQSKLGGYSDWQTALGVQNSDVNSKLGVINNEARGNAALLPGQIEAASHKGDALSAWGKVIGSLGTVVGAAGGGSWGSGGPSVIGEGQAPGGGSLYGTFEPGEV